MKKPLQRKPLKKRHIKQSKFVFKLTKTHFIVGALIIVVALILSTVLRDLYQARSRNQTRNISASPTPSPLPSPYLIKEKKINTQSDFDVATWQTYSQTKYGYSIKYPSSWTLKSIGEDYTELFNFDADECVYGDSFNDQNMVDFSITVHEHDQPQTINEIKSRLQKDVDMCNKPGAGCAPAPPEFIRDISINGREGVRTPFDTAHGCLDGERSAYFIPYKNNVYKIDVIKGRKIDKNYEALFNKVINSLTLDGNVIHYTDDTFSFNYPSNWIVNKDDLQNDSLGKFVTLSTPDNMVHIIISQEQKNYGVEWETKKNPLQLTIDGKQYSVIEESYGENNVFVDFILSPSGYHVLFGTGYPSGNDSPRGSFSSYKEVRNDIINILSSLKIYD